MLGPLNWTTIRVFPKLKRWPKSQRSVLLQPKLEGTSSIAQHWAALAQNNLHPDFCTAWIMLNPQPKTLNLKLVQPSAGTVQVSEIS